MLRPTTTTEIPPPSAPKDIAAPKPRSSSPRTRRTPSFLFDSPPSAPLAPTTSNATATSTSKPTKSKNNKDNILSSPQSPRRSFFPSPSKSSFSSANSGGGSSGFAGGIFSLSSLLARMPSAASIVPVLSSSHHHNHHPDLPNNHSSPASKTTPTTSQSSRKMAGGSSKDKPSEPSRMTAAEKQEAVRNAQAILASVRKDWEWAEELRKSKRRRMAGATAGSPTTSSSLPSIQSEEEEDTEDEDEREYRSRDESDTDDGSRQPGSMKSVRSVYPDDEPRSAYRFHDPNTIGGSKATKEERKARRRKDLEDEMKWNDGLRIWIERRDLWTQADKNGRVPIGKSKFEDVSPTTANINPLDLDAIRFQDGFSYRAKWKNELLTLTPNYARYQNPFYDAIIPDAYPQLYQRIIIKSNTPTIPINLQHMTNALIEGWKADGQWPPKPSRPEASITKKKTVSVGESMVKRVFGIGR
ncbi:hypothetical protein AOL_s00081g191 [Orbilia oligospora ATCC 24927]|uniref:Gag1-like clamp domain-containing protein n=1 Tax=Arthrobotrys oligospora (strain ATCC 24927 / CBS 115.81 / DSM 1491) TaxID=756982 RepID=G1XFP8_ARTOA|nr:hypothetical protein AOL_s00081g191 [Orbilia oligospora ATCC 24927]EGX47864.1 hypothetical protein AOL_s00081g191 [Orbilia oligospora ATCC 24927]